MADHASASAPEPPGRRPVRSRLGAHARDVEFTDEDLAEVRAEMGDRVGDDLTS